MVRLLLKKIREWNALMQNAEAEHFGTGKIYQNPMLRWCDSILRKAAWWPVLGLVLMFPLLGILIAILMLFGQAPDSVIKAFTETSDWNLSLRQAPQNVMYDEHYLCTVAAGGHEKVVKPIRLGRRHGHEVIVNRQLCIANAFEQVLEGERVTLTNGDDADETQKVSAEAYVLNEEVLAQAVEILSKEHLENVAMDSTHISGTLSLEEAGRLILSVPYEEGWTVQIDGENAEPEQFGDALMAFDLEAGEHTIQMHYVPEGRNIGILVSAGSVLILLGYVLCQRCDRKRKDCAENEPSQKAADETMENGNAEKTHTEEGPVKEEAGRM